jgi:hypothetical protein
MWICDRFSSPPNARVPMKRDLSATYLFVIDAVPSPCMGRVWYDMRDNYCSTQRSGQRHLSTLYYTWGMRFRQKWKDKRGFRGFTLTRVTFPRLLLGYVEWWKLMQVTCTSPHPRNSVRSELLLGCRKTRIGDADEMG